MIYSDPVYGKFEINEPVIIDLINSPSLQRLKKIDQAGYFEPHFPGASDSRFTHSVGDYLLLWKFNAPLEEQVAGLIHDISHSAFSHCIDYVLSSGSEKNHTHQDNVFDAYVRKSEIPQLLKKYNLNLDYILDDKNFPLKENDLPDICSDRIDYSLRSAVTHKLIPNGKYFTDHLFTEKNKWVFKNLSSAQVFASLFFKLNREFYSGFPSALMFRTVGDYLKHSLEKEYINEIDLYTDDKSVLLKIKPYHKKDKKLHHLYRRMNNKISSKNNPDDYDATVYCKSRVVDPYCLYKGKVLRLSEINVEWKQVVKEESQPRKYFIKFEE